MKQRSRLGLITLGSLLLQACSGGSSGGGANIQTRFAAANVAPGGEKFRGGANSATGLSSLKYRINSISICESLEVQGSGYNNPTNCVELYRHDVGAFSYGLNDDWTPLGDLARRSDEGFIDLMSASSRQQLAGSTVLTHEHARSYHYGLINWSLPIKVTAQVAMSDGSLLYTHDGASRFETTGVDAFRSYFTEVATPLSQAPAEEAVVLLPNGGNWFKFQSPFVITDADIDERREFVLDLVFNPTGIVKGYEDSFAQGQLSERDATGKHVRDITVPMLDLSPVPHRASEQVMRESYQGAVTAGDRAFDLRVELYYVEGDPSGTLYGVDVKTLVNAQTNQVVPEISKVTFTSRAADGSLVFASHKNLPILTGLQRVSGGSGSTRVALACATHTDRAAAEGGAAIVLDSCPAPTLDVTLQLVAREPVVGGLTTAVGGGPDAGVDAGGT
jgi:hypothetical protein